MSMLKEHAINEVKFQVVEKSSTKITCLVKMLKKTILALDA
jgi:hypothetical protein